MNTEKLINLAKHTSRRLRSLQSVIGLLLLLAVAIFVSPRNNGQRLCLKGMDDVLNTIVEDVQKGQDLWTIVEHVNDIDCNPLNVLRQISIIGIMALGMTFVILTAGIDLSVGSILALSGVTVSWLLTAWQPGLSPGLHILAAIAGAVGLCTLVGLACGMVVAHLKIQPFVATLAAMIGIRGLTKYLVKNTNIGLSYAKPFADNVSSTFAHIFSLKLPVIFTFAILAILLGLILSRTVFGRYVRALGDNAQAAHYAGLPTRKILMMVYMLSGLLAGVAGVLHAAQGRQGNPNAGMAYELDVIAAVVIGGTSLAGGKGRIFGTIVGALFMGVLINMLGLQGVDTNVQYMIKAVIIIAAVTLQQERKRAA